MNPYESPEEIIRAELAPDQDNHNWMGAAIAVGIAMGIGIAACLGLLWLI